MKRLSRLLPWTPLLVLALTGFSLRAATPYALLTGSVFDRSGAPLEGASVRLLNPSIGFSQNQTTDSLGTFTFPTVPPAEDYFISVEKTAFATQIRQGIQVAVAEVKMVLPPFLLQPAARAEVAPPHAGQQPQTAAGAAKQPQTPERTTEPTVSLDLLSSTLGGVVDSRMVHTLPLRDRDFIDLALLVPGTYPVEQGSVLEGASLAVNGVRANMNNFLLDGADNNDYTINQSLPFQIVEALQEFRVQTSTSTAEYGRSGGAQINSVSRSGSNTLHGTLFEFHRNSALSPNGFVSVYAGGGFDQSVSVLRHLTIIDQLTDPTLARLYDRRHPQSIQNQFGGNVGGAIKKDKLFGFFNWESFRVSNPRPIFEEVAETVFRSQSECDAFFSYFGFPFPCDRQGLALLSLYPASNVPDAAPTRCSGFCPSSLSDQKVGPAWFVGESANRTASDNFLERLDWRKSPRDSMSFKHSVQRIEQVQGGTVARSASYPGNGTEVNGRNQNFSYNYIQQFSHLSNELRLGWSRLRLNTLALDRDLDPSSFGFQHPNFTNKGLPLFSPGAPQPLVANLPALGSDLAAPNARANNVWSLSDSLSLLRGRHNWKLGGEVRYTRLNVLNEAFGRGMLASGRTSEPVIFYAEFGPSCLYTLPVPGCGISDFASIARVSSTFGGGFDRSFRAQSFNWFVQDQWRLRSNLTLNYGLRYEVNTAPVELRNRLVNYFPDLGGLVRVTTKDVLDPLGNVVATAPDIVARGGFRTDWNNFGPRFGFAWDPWGKSKTVVRGGYALVFDQQPLEASVNMLLNPPFVMQDQTYFPYMYLFDTFSVCDPTLPPYIPTTGCLSSPASSARTFSSWQRQPYSIAARDPNTRTSYVHQFNLDIQQQAGSKGLLELAYVGSVGHKLPRLRDLTPCSLAAIFDFYAYFSSGSPYPGGCGSPFAQAEILNQENTAHSNFHSLLLRFQTRAFFGLQFDVRYQFSKSIDDAPSIVPQTFILSNLKALGFGNCSGSVGCSNPVAGHSSFSPTLSLRPQLPIINTLPSLPQDSTNLRLERGRSDFDIGHRLVMDFIYDVPRWERLGTLGRGWQLAGISTVQSGQPYSVFLDYFGLPLRPSLHRSPRIQNGYTPSAIENSQALQNFSFTCWGFCFANVAANPNSPFDITPTLSLRPGSLGRNTFTGPGVANLDFSVLKNTYLGKRERKSLQFRIESFNLFNTANFRLPYSHAGTILGPYNTCGDPNCTTLKVFDYVNQDPFFGRILQARPAREIQFALKLFF